MRTVIIGGTFNPVHVGPLLLAEEVRVQEGFDQVVFVPSNKPAHKVVDGTTVAQRLDMLRLAVEGYDVVLETCELSREGISYSIDTVRYLLDHYSLAGKPALVLGDDLFESFSTWKDAAALADLAELLVAHRKYAHRLESPWPHRYLDNKLVDVSSTEIRDRVRSGRAWRSLVPPAVAAYIESHRLYREPNRPGAAP
jgi:nicotinate-nucleotide adenylyltransferase